MSETKNQKTPNSLYAAAYDLNGIWRGKRMPIEQLENVMNGSLRMPISTLSTDIWGRDIKNSPLVFETGDQDGFCMPTERGLIETSTNSIPLLPVWVRTENDEPLDVDPRQILKGAVDRAHALGLRPVMALEMEFYLTSLNQGHPSTVPSAFTNGDIESDNYLSIDQLEDYEMFFDAIYANSKVQGIAVDTAICEAGQGQFEINLLHSDDPMKSADDAVLFKRLVKSIAKEQGIYASFMAKPFADRSGSGMHVHFSLLNEKNENIFNDGTEKGSHELQSAVGGLLSTMEECSLIWAPHLNSYRRYQPSSHAPTGISWGYENRTAAIRIPGGPPQARRLEHRISGADANPYLVLAAIIHSALDGIESKTQPPNPIEGDVYALDLAHLPQYWMDAIRGFESSAFIEARFPKLFKECFAKTKRQEYDQLNDKISLDEIKTYLTQV